MKQVISILASITKTMPHGSRFWFDYVSEDLIENSTGVRRVESYMKNMRKMGEPFINGYNNACILAEKYHLTIEQDIHSGTVLGIEEDIYKHYSFCILRGE